MFKRGDKVVCINVNPILHHTADLLKYNKVYTVSQVIQLEKGLNTVGLEEIQGVYYHAERFVLAKDVYIYDSEPNKEFYDKNSDYGLF